MTDQELHDLKRRHNLTGRAIAEIVGVNPRTVRKWLGPLGKHHAPIPYAAARLLAITVGDEPCPPKYKPKERQKRQGDD